MDVRIEAGDVYQDVSGRTSFLTGVWEAAQRVLFAVTTAKGSFIYNRSLGTDYGALSGAVTDSTALRDQLEMLIREAAAGIEGTRIAVTAVDSTRSRVGLCITHGAETINTEVDLYGNL